MNPIRSLTEKIKKVVNGGFFFLLFFSLILIFSSNFASAQLGNWDDSLISGATKTDLYETDVATEGGAAATIAGYVGNIFSFITPLLSILYIAIIIWSGYEWMSASGSKEKIESSKKRMTNATIGIVIFAILYFLAYFFVSQFGTIAGYTI